MNRGAGKQWHVTAEAAVIEGASRQSQNSDEPDGKAIKLRRVAGCSHANDKTDTGGKIGFKL